MGDAVHATLADSVAILDEKVAKAEDDIRRIQATIAETRKERNALQPVSRLPPEILLDIFKYLHPKYASSRRSSVRESRDWLIVTKVRTSWRNLAINTTELWNELCCFNNLERINAYVERSRDRGLVIILNKNDFSQGAFNIVKELMGRTVKLVLMCLRNSEFWESARVLFADPKLCSRLKELVLSAVPTERIILDWMTECRFPNNLDKLGFHYAHVPWNHAIYRGLRILDIEVSHNLWPTLSEFLDILESCSSLNKLILSGIGPQMSPLSREYSIDMPHLKVIKLDGIHFEMYLRIFQRIRLPETITSCSVIGMDYDFSSPVSIIPPSLNRVIPDGFDDFNVYFRNLKKLDLEFKLSWKNNPARSQCTVHIKLTGSRSSEEHVTFQIISQIIPEDIVQRAGKSNIHLHGIKSTNVRLADGSALAALFSRITNFPTLSILDGHRQIFACALDALEGMVQGSDCSAQHSHVSQPQKIRFARYRLALTGEKDQDIDVLKKLVDYLKLRKTNGIPLNVLKLNQAVKFEENLEKELRDLVVLADMQSIKP